MSYKHKWVNPESRYVVLSTSGATNEFKTKTSATEWFRSLRAFDEAADLIQRYTDQQMELEALNEGWVLFEIGCGDVCLPYPSKREVEIVSNDMKTFNVWTNSFWANTEVNGLHVIAYRLSNADGYKEGVKVEPKTPVSCEICHHEWTAIKGNEETEPCPGCHDAPLSVNTKTELPAIGSKVKLAHSFPGFTAMTGDSGKEVVILSHTVAPNGAKVAVYCSENCNIGAISGIAVAQAFDPIQSERDKVIAKAHSVIDLEWDYFRNKRFEDLYDAGMLTMPDKENK